MHTISGNGAHPNAYWGKATPGNPGESALYHPLPYHSLDVAAVGSLLIKLPVFSLQSLADDLQWPLAQVEALCIFFLAAHDLGKFSRAFQGLAPNLSPDLVPPVPGKRYDQRHDTLGWLVWRDAISESFPGGGLPVAGDDFWADWVRACVGHHGCPPLDNSHGGAFQLEAASYFCPEDIQAAKAFLADVAQWLLPSGIPVPSRGQRVAIKRHGWRLAGLAVLADWLGSDQRQFSYRTEVMPLVDYWREIALPIAERVVRSAGLTHVPVRYHDRPFDLFDYLKEPTPLQQLAADIELDDGPQLFMLEDVTGAGKTEAALILVYRLMQQGRAQGFYFGLPTMATANQMYRRVGSVYRKLYSLEATPSLILAHGARHLVEQSVVQQGSPPGDRNYQYGEHSAGSQCSAWLADNRKKALLAQVGVGTLDQALLGVLPVRHQSLRLLGLAGKVLVADEVHAYDPYMRKLLAALLRAHASQGGSAILLSATLPADMRDELATAFLSGRGSVQEEIPQDMRYPLVTHVHHGVSAYACATRPSVQRTVRVQWLHDEASVLELIRAQAQQGRSICWIRNTVDDARRAFAALNGVSAAFSGVTLFHSRYAMGDRLDIEEGVLARFDKASTQAVRAGQVLAATQVVEQSLDLDFDVMISDLAPVDLLIQRAGRLHRHIRDANGNPAAQESRPAPVLHILAPRPVQDPAPNWYSELFPRGSFVYPDVGRLWLTQQALTAAGAIASPGQPGEAAGVRALVEAVYGEHGASIPDALLAATRKQEGVVLAEISQANFNLLNFSRGYCDESSRHWYEDSKVPTRLGEETTVLYLVREDEDGLHPWGNADVFPWDYAAVRVDARHVGGLSPAWETRFGAQIKALRTQSRLLDEPALILPLVVDQAGQAKAEIVDRSGAVMEVHYNSKTGLVLGGTS